MFDKDLENYQQRFIADHGVPLVYHAVRKAAVHNMPDSANRYPQGRIGWIHYWRAFSGCTGDFVKCSCCGKELSVHKELKPLHEAFARYCSGCCEYSYAEGGHIEIKGQAGIADGIYITPLCAECNNQFDQDIEILPMSVIVEEVAPIIDKD